MKDSLTIKIRKIKAKITGNVPCSFESKHGHDFVDREDSDTILECSVCKLQVYFCPLMRGFCKV